MKKKVKFKIGNAVALIAIVFFSLLFIYSSYNIIKWFIAVKQNSNIKEELNKSIKRIKPKTEAEEVQYEIDFKKLKEINKDTIAYIKVNNTNIDYVVVRGMDNEYYLKHNFEKKWNIAGWIFADYHNEFDGSDKNIVIFGHNTKDGSMFGSLKNVLDKNWYENKENWLITLVTEQGTFNYQVFSSYEIEPEMYYINTKFDNLEDYAKFLNTIKKRSVYDYGVEVSNTDKILTLSSCMGEGQTRIALHAKLINNENED